MLRFKLSCHGIVAQEMRYTNLIRSLTIRVSTLFLLIQIIRRAQNRWRARKHACERTHGDTALIVQEGVHRPVKIIREYTMAVRRVVNVHPPKVIG